MTIKQIDAAIAAEHGNTKLSRNYLRWLESLRDWTVRRQQAQTDDLRPRRVREIEAMRRGVA